MSLPLLPTGSQPPLSSPLYPGPSSNYYQELPYSSYPSYPSPSGFHSSSSPQSMFDSKYQRLYERTHQRPSYSYPIHNAMSLYTGNLAMSPYNTAMSPYVGSAAMSPYVNSVYPQSPYALPQQTYYPAMSYGGYGMPVGGVGMGMGGMPIYDAAAAYGYDYDPERSLHSPYHRRWGRRRRRFSFRPRYPDFDDGYYDD